MKSALNNIRCYIISRKNRLPKYFLVYSVPAIIGAAADFFCFILIYITIKNIFLSNFISFIFGTTANYLACKIPYLKIKTRKSSKIDLLLLYLFTYFVVLLNTFFIYSASQIYSLFYVKILSFGISYLLNFFLRKQLVFNR